MMWRLEQLTYLEVTIVSDNQSVLYGGDGKFVPRTISECNFTLKLYFKIYGSLYLSVSRITTKTETDKFMDRIMVDSLFFNSNTCATK